MASSCMGINLIFSLLISTLLLVLSTDKFTVAVSAQSLQETVCDKTAEPLFCHDCLASNSQIPQQSVHDIVGVTLTCGLKQSLKVINLLENLTRITTGDPQVWYQYCLKQIKVVNSDLTVARDKWSIRDYVDASQMMSISSDDYFKCAKTGPRQWIAPLPHDMMFLTRYIDVSEGIFKDQLISKSHDDSVFKSDVALHPLNKLSVVFIFSVLFFYLF